MFFYLTMLVLPVGIAVTIYNAAKSGSLELRDHQPVLVADLARRLGLTLVEGNPTLDLASPVTLRGIPNVSIRMVGMRNGRNVELVHRRETSVAKRGFLGSEWTERVDLRLTMYVGSTEQLEVVHRVGENLSRRTVMQPILVVGTPAIDEKLELRAAHASLLTPLATELLVLADMPAVHVTLVDGRLSLQEDCEVGLLPLYAERILPVFDRIADQLEVLSMVEDDEGSQRAMTAHVPLALATELGEVVDTLHPSPGPMLAAGAATVAFALASPYLAVLGAAEGSLEKLALAAALAIAAVLCTLAAASGARSKIVLRQHGFEWYRLRGVAIFRYADVIRPELEVSREGSQTNALLSFDTRDATHIISGFDGIDRLAHAMRAGR